MTPSGDLFRLTGVGIVQTDITTGHFLRANRTFCEMVGYSEEELKGMTNAELTHPADWERDAEQFTAMRRGEVQQDQAITRALHKDGHEVWLELNITLLGEGDEIENIAVVNDVTKHRQAEATAKELEARLGAFITASTDVVYSMSADWTEMRFLTGKNFLADMNQPSIAWLDTYIPDEDRMQVMTVIEEAIRSKSIFNLEHRVVQADGSIGWTASRAIPLLDERSEVGGWFGTATDITERRRNDEKLRESEARYRALFTSIDEAYALCRIVTDETGQPSDYLLLDVNPAFEKMTGITPEAAQGATARELVPGLEDWWIETYGRVALEGETVRFENRVAEMDRWFDAYAGPVGESGSGLFALVFTDITERKQAEASIAELNETLEQQVKARTMELERSNIRFSQAFTLAPFPALISSLDRHETFLEVNEAFLEMTRYSKDEIIGKQAFDLGMWYSKEDQRKLVEAQKDGRGFRDLDLQLRDKEGNVLDIQLSAEVIRIDGHEGYLKMFHDVTEKKRTDEQMMQAVDALMADASWFSQGFVARLNHIRSGGMVEDYRPTELSPREREVLVMLAMGWSNKRISEQLELKTQTIRNYVSAIFDKLGVHSRTEAAVWARERGLIGK